MSLLPDPETFRRLVDGTTPGAGPAALRLVLASLSVPYEAAVSLRNAGYDRGWLATAAAPVPVISVGNLTLGGTGKTPLVAWLVRLLASHGRRPAVVSRGYAADASGTSDEAAELSLLVPGLTHVAHRDRVAAARTAAESGADVVVLDDGFQHRRLARELDIVAVDASDPFGCGHLVPRGLLREPLASLARADAIVLTRAAEPARRAAIRTRLAAACRGRLPPVWAEAEHEVVGLRSASGVTSAADTIRGRRVLGFCGIGNPGAFRATLTGLGVDLAGFEPFADHHAFTPDELAGIAAAARAAGAGMLVTTVKDLVRIRRTDVEGVPIVAVEIAMHILSGGAELEAAVLRTIAGRTAPAEART